MVGQLVGDGESCYLADIAEVVPDFGEGSLVAGFHSKIEGDNLAEHRRGLKYSVIILILEHEIIVVESMVTPFTHMFNVRGHINTRFLFLH